jgi:hypothetical protein
VADFYQVFEEKLHIQETHLGHDVQGYDHN